MHKYRKLFAYAKRQRRTFLLIFVLTVTASALLAAQPWPMILLVDHVLKGAPWPSFLQNAFQRFSLEPSPAVLLPLLVLGGLILFVLSSLLEALLAWSWTRAGRRMVYDLAEDLFARLQRRSLIFHSRHSVGDIMSRITVDSWCVYQVVDALFFTPAHALLAMAGMIFLMSQLDVTLTIIALVTAPFMVSASFLVTRPLRAAAKMKRDVESRIASHIQQTLTGIPVVQAFAQEERESQRLQKYADAAIQAQQRSTLIGSINSLSSGLVTTLGTGVILWFGARHVLAGTLMIGGLLGFLFYLNSLQTQMKTFANIHTTLQGINASVDRVLEVLEAVPEVVEKPGAPALPPVRGLVQFDRVVFGYERGRPVLRGLLLEVKPGQSLALVGSTGAGKTTLVNLIPRLIDPWEGRVLVDGHDIRDVQIKSLRNQVAFVLQDSFLFPFSVADNIAYGRPEAKRSEIQAAAKAANAHQFIERLPQGYDTVIGERGATVSGGERQRLAIARALLKNAPILILDEPTSALDAETERLIMEALDRLMEGRTTFIVAHRLSTVRRADRIAVLQNGQITETGTHEELLAHGNVYAGLHRLQFDMKRQAAEVAG